MVIDLKDLLKDYIPQEKNFGELGAYPVDWKMGDPINIVHHVIYNSSADSLQPVPCIICEQLILEYEETIREHFDKKEFVFVRHHSAKNTYNHGATCFSSTLQKKKNSDKPTE